MRKPASQELTPARIAAIQAMMRVFVDDDLARGVTPNQRLYCDPCQRPQPMLGFIQYDRYQMCNACATEYEVARARGVSLSAGQFVREKSFGEAEAYALASLTFE